MSGIGFLMIVVVVTIIGSVIVWLRHRQPNNPLASVDDFQREMQALGTTPPAVADGNLEARPRSRMNTVSVRPNVNPVDSTVASVDDDSNGTASENNDDQTESERN
jgi:hypothetical protein